MEQIHWLAMSTSISTGLFDTKIGYVTMHAKRIGSRGMSRFGEGAQKEAIAFAMKHDVPVRLYEDETTESQSYWISPKGLAQSLKPEQFA